MDIKNEWERYRNKKKNLKTSWQNYFWILKHVFLLLIHVFFFLTIITCSQSLLHRDIFRQQDKVYVPAKKKVLSFSLTHCFSTVPFCSHLHYFSIFQFNSIFFFVHTHEPSKAKNKFDVFATSAVILSWTLLCSRHCYYLPLLLVSRR